MGNGKVIALYITVGCLAFVTSKIILSILLYKRWKRKHMSSVQDSYSGGKMVMFRSSTMKSIKPEAFLKTTLKLSNKDVIGSGGYGTVYKLAVNESTSFAIKRLNRGSAERDRGFERELEAMGDIKHRNIVTLFGYYTSPHFNLLIYELMPNGSLDSYLHGRSKSKKHLDWPSRHKIAIGAARGIAYLHHDCIPHVIHRDIKSSNILLDENMEARVSDFGLATLMEPNQTHVSTVVAGTFGYLAPEYFDTGKATAKGDVYSFGVVLLELLTGKKPMDEAFEEGTKLVTWKLAREGMVAHGQCRAPVIAGICLCRVKAGELILVTLNFSHFLETEMALYWFHCLVGWWLTVMLPEQVDGCEVLLLCFSGGECCGYRQWLTMGFSGLRGGEAVAEVEPKKEGG